MSTRNVPVNRAAVGWIALGCLIAAALLFGVIQTAPDQGGLVFLQGGLARVGLLMGAVWLALPSRTQDAAWANLSPRTVIALLLAMVLSTRVNLKILIPAALAVGGLILILRPRPKHRPSDHIVRSD